MFCDYHYLDDICHGRNVRKIRIILFKSILIALYTLYFRKYSNCNINTFKNIFL